MRWVVKAALHKGVSALPRSEAVNYVLQRHATHTLPTGEPAFRRKFRRALLHVGAYAEHGPDRPLGEAVFYEVGPGWDAVVPLSFWALGVDRQVLVDVRPNLRPELVAITIERFRGLRPELEQAAGRPLRDPGFVDEGPDPDLLRRAFGIEYLAPFDARATGLETASVDFITSTSTLEHVPAEDLEPLIAECRRLLRADGALSFQIDLQDHFSYADRRLSPYNFLRYSDRTWRLVNSDLNHQNRLRRSDYLRLLEAAGLTVVAERAKRPHAEKVESLRGLDLAPRFRDYPLDDLAVTRLDVAARAAGALPDAAQELADLRG